MPADTDLELELDRLYALPPGEFTSARDEAAKRLRGEGQRELADRVKQLRKPPVAVWLVNRLAHERALDVQRLLRAGEALAESQTAAASGGAAEAFAEARREEQHALERLADAARELARRESVGAPAVERAVQTLRAASLTAAGRDLLKAGRLTEELQPTGFDALTPGAAPKLAKPAKARKPRNDQERRRQVTAARERVKQLRAKERELGNAARGARREAERAQAEAARLAKAAEGAEAKAAAAAEARGAAEAELRGRE